MNQETIELFQTLTQLPGTSGNEHQVRAFMKTELEKYSDEIIQDRLGSIFGVRKGPDQAPKVMVAGHMDEVGFMVTSITENGMLRFQTLGGWWSQVMLAQRVLVYTENGTVPGVIGSIPPHLLSEEQRNRPMQIKNMQIDIGADDKKDAESLGIKPGQHVYRHGQSKKNYGKSMG
jgi:putative aminopeptidase FrvX